MDSKRICDTCRYYYAYGLTNGACMLFLLSKESIKDKDVRYTEYCDDWIENDDRKVNQELRYSYEELKKEYALRNHIK